MSHPGPFHKLKKDRQKKDVEDTKGVIRISKLKKDRQHNGQKKKDKRTNNNLQNITHKTKYRVTRTPLKTSGTRRVTLVTNPVISHEWGKERKVFTTIGINHKTFEVMTSTYPVGTLGSVASLLAALYRVFSVTLTYVIFGTIAKHE